MPSYTTEQFWQLYDLLPQDLKEALFAEKTSAAIENICQKHQLSNEQLAKLVDLITDVLLGILPPEDFEQTLKTGTKLNAQKAKKITQEITRLIFFPVKSSLAEIYGKEIFPLAKPLKETQKEKPKGKDVYREPIE